MQPETETDHIALLALTISGVLVQRLNEVGQLDDVTRRHLHQLVSGVRTHAERRGLGDLRILFDNLERALSGTSA